MLRHAWMWGLLTLASAGCSCHLTSEPPVDVDIREACAAIAHDSRCHIYLFFLRGCDPLDCAGVQGLKETMESLGFQEAWCGLPYHVKAFRKTIAQIHHDDPKSHFVLVGHGKGIDSAVELAKAIGTQNIQVQLLVGLGKRVDCPACVCRQLTLVPCGKGGDDRDVLEIHVKGWHSLPAHPQTVEILARQLFALGGSIPSETDLPKMYYPDKEPTPKPVMPPASVRRDDWDFLLPRPVDDGDNLPPGTLPLPRKKSSPTISARLAGS